MVQTTGANSAGTRSARKRAEILRRATQVFSRKGFHAAGMREIARGLGMAPGALYYYFESKEDLLYACQMLSLERLLESAGDIAVRPLPAATRLRLLIHAHLAHVLGEFGGSLAHVEFHALPETMLGEVVAKRDEYERLVRDVVQDGDATGEFRTANVKLTALALLGALNWTVVWWRPEQGSPMAIADGIADSFLKGLEVRA